MTDVVRPADDTRLLRQQLGHWVHRDIADEQALKQALQRWPLLAELADEQAGSEQFEADL